MHAAQHRSARVLSLTLMIVACSGCSASADPGSTPSPPGVGVVEEVVDGDTVEVRYGDATIVVRLLGIDTPETQHPSRPIECHGAEATDALRALLPPGTAITLARDVELLDVFGRTLAHITRATDDTWVNGAMVAGGHADTLMIEPNRALAGELTDRRNLARQSQLGLWGTCGGPHVPASPP